MVAESGALVALKVACQAENGAGEPCRATPQLNSRYCFWHDPETAEDAQNARRLGGYNRRREHVLERVYDLDGLESGEQFRRILQIALADTLAQGPGTERARMLLKIGECYRRLAEADECAPEPRA